LFALYCILEGWRHARFAEGCGSNFPTILRAAKNPSNREVLGFRTRRIEKMFFNSQNSGWSGCRLCSSCLRGLVHDSHHPDQLSLYKGGPEP
jgi:hypothetical protein